MEAAPPPPRLAGPPPTDVVADQSSNSMEVVEVDGFTFETFAEKQPVAEQRLEERQEEHPAAALTTVQLPSLVSVKLNLDREGRWKGMLGLR